MRHRFAAVAVFAFPSWAMADSVSFVLSDASSDGTSAAFLDARYDFSLDSGVLELTATNTTDTNFDQRFDFVQIYGNFPGGTSFSESSFPSDWSLLVDEDNIRVDGFGEFDWCLTTDNNGNVIEPGNSLTFSFLTDSTDVRDFVDHQSVTGSPKNMAGKWVSGTGTGLEEPDDSAFGGGGQEVQPIPLPSAAFLALGGIGAIGLRRHR